MRKALVVGIDHYDSLPGLHGCVTDAFGVKPMLERHGDGTVNFAVKVLVSTATTGGVTRSDLRTQIQHLFEGDSEIALFFYAGHGHIEATGGYLLASDSRSGDDGVALSDVLTWANDSAARNRVIVLDSCHSGIAGSSRNSPGVSELKEGSTILTASTPEQYASEENGKGVFTGLLVDALAGAACNLVGEITPGSVYAHIDQSLGPWDQRPVFKTNVKSFVSLRRVQPPVEVGDLRRITEFFPTPGFDFALDPSFEPEAAGRRPGDPEPIPANTEKFAILQKFNRVNLVVPIGALHMWNAAMERKACRLTALGEHYRQLVAKGRI